MLRYLTDRGKDKEGRQIMGTIIRSTMRLLCRNKGFWFFLLATPLLSTLVLSIKQGSVSMFEAVGEMVIHELDQVTDRVAYFGGKGKYVVKVYDACGSDLSEYFLKKLTESGAILVCRAKAPEMTKKDVDERTETDGFNDRMGSSIYIGKSFDSEALAGDMKDGLAVYTLSDDERKELLASEINLVIGQIKTAGAQAGGSTADVVSTLTKMNETLPAKEVETFAATDSVNLNNEQREQTGLVGYAFAILTLGYVFGGIFIAHTVINERKDMVMTRIRLTNLSDTGYFAGKLLSAVIVSAGLTVVMAACSFLISTEKLGMGRIEFIAMIFLLGLIFSTISLVVGVLLGNVMSANIAAFALWSMSSMLAGLYFPLDSTSNAIKTISYIMPQKWFMRGTELSMANDNSAFLIVLGVTAAYLIVTLSLGSVGIKLKKNE